MEAENKHKKTGKEKANSSLEDTAIHSAFDDQTKISVVTRPNPTEPSIPDACPQLALAKVTRIQIVIDTVQGELEVVCHMPERNFHLSSTPFGVRRWCSFENEMVEVSYVALKEPFRNHT